MLHHIVLSGLKIAGLLSMMMCRTLTKAAQANATARKPRGKAKRSGAVAKKAAAKVKAAGRGDELEFLDIVMNSQSSFSIPNQVIPFDAFGLNLP